MLKKHLTILLILSLAVILRFYHLGSLPISLFGDEVDVGYHAWSLATTLRDYTGQFLPSYIHSLTEWRAPLLMYVTAPFVLIFGPTPFAVRFAPALLGTLSVYLIYLLANKLFPNQYLKILNLKLKIGSLAALLLATSPWHLHYSRAAFEVTLLLFLVLLGTYFFLNKKFVFSSIFFALCFYTYSTATVFVPLLIIILLVINKPRLNIKAVLLFFIFLLPLAYHLLLGQAANRFSQISIFNDRELVDSIILQRTAPWVKPDLIETFFHNKPLAFANSFTVHYLQSFSPQFLFLDGDPLFRHSISQSGELLWLTLPFLIIGIISTASLLREKPNQLLLSWLLIAPIPSALTQGGGMQATRLFLMLPPLIILTAIGLDRFIQTLKLSWRPLAVSVTAILLTLNFVSFWHRYTNHYKFESARIWQYGYRDIFTKLANIHPSGKVYLNNTYEPSLLHFLFNTQYPPSIFQKELADIKTVDFSNQFTGFVFADKYFFGQLDDHGDIATLLESGDIYVAVQGKEVPGDWDWLTNPPAKIKPLEVTYDVFGKPLFYIVTKSQ